MNFEPCPVCGRLYLHIPAVAVVCHTCAAKAKQPEQTCIICGKPYWRSKLHMCPACTAAANNRFYVGIHLDAACLDELQACRCGAPKPAESKRQYIDSLRRVWRFDSASA